MLAAGIGITPLLAMLRHVLYEGIRRQAIRPTTLVYAARSKADRAFDDELAQIREASNGAIRIVRVLGDPEGREQGTDFDIAGRINTDLLSRLLPSLEADFYLCGPPLFMQALYDGLCELDVADDLIHAEAFGPSSLKRTVAAASPKQQSPVATQSVPVLFVGSGKEARWEPDTGTLLDLAEARGLDPVFGCRSGTCRTCAVKLVAGTVAYIRDTHEMADDEVLICSAVPARGSGPIQLDL